MSGIRTHYIRIIVAWIGTLAALYALQAFFS